ncbi:hypothetical protein J3458_003561 [Metarhizium acridum]|uniref:uncharacterized protein n=1 Tax=Metarhizium acridum TaxID=92637 RepID=UPI001C6D1625|nr:hypothetical protein J3458_003561 [Metarhizium acridum]
MMQVRMSDEPSPAQYQAVVVLCGLFYGDLALSVSSTAVTSTANSQYRPLRSHQVKPRIINYDSRPCVAVWSDVLWMNLLGHCFPSGCRCSTSKPGQRHKRVMGFPVAFGCYKEDSSFPCWQKQGERSLWLPLELHPPT